MAKFDWFHIWKSFKDENPQHRYYLCSASTSINMLSRYQVYDHENILGQAAHLQQTQNGFAYEPLYRPKPE
jgi:hypothetical protein